MFRFQVEDHAAQTFAETAEPVSCFEKPIWAGGSVNGCMILWFGVVFSMICSFSSVASAFVLMVVLVVGCVPSAMEQEC